MARLSSSTVLFPFGLFGVTRLVIRSHRHSPMPRHHVRLKDPISHSASSTTPCQHLPQLKGLAVGIGVHTSSSPSMSYLWLALSTLASTQAPPCHLVWGFATSFNTIENYFDTIVTMTSSTVQLLSIAMLGQMVCHLASASSLTAMLCHHPWCEGIIISLSVVNHLAITFSLGECYQFWHHQEILQHHLHTTFGSGDRCQHWHRL